MAIIARAMIITGVSEDLQEDNINTVLNTAILKNGYAKEYIALSIKTGVLNVRSNQIVASRLHHVCISSNYNRPTSKKIRGH